MRYSRDMRGHGEVAPDPAWPGGARIAVQIVVNYEEGGENSIVVYAIDQKDGTLKPIQHIETQKIHPRTFHIHPSARLMVAEHNLPVNVRDGDAVKTVAAGLTVFRMGEDGKLTFARTYDVDVGDKTMFWMGMVPLGA